MPIACTRRTVTVLSDVDERVPERGGTVVAVAGVLRRPALAAGAAAERDRRVEHHRGGPVAAVEGGGVEQRLDRRAGLAASLDGAVELAALEVVPADHRLHLARCTGRSPPCAPSTCGILVERVAHGAVAGALAATVTATTSPGLKRGRAPGAACPSRAPVGRRGRRAPTRCDGQPRRPHVDDDRRRWTASVASSCRLALQERLDLVRVRRCIAPRKPCRRSSTRSPSWSDSSAMALQLEIDRGVHAQPELRRGRAAVALLEQAPHVLDVPGRRHVGRRAAGAAGRRAARREASSYSSVGDELLVAACAIQHVVLAGAAPAWDALGSYSLGRCGSPASSAACAMREVRDVDVEEGARRGLRRRRRRRRSRSGSGTDRGCRPC